MARRAFGQESVPADAAGTPLVGRGWPCERRGSRDGKAQSRKWSGYATARGCRSRCAAAGSSSVVEYRRGGVGHGCGVGAPCAASCWAPGGRGLYRWRCWNCPLRRRWPGSFHPVSVAASSPVRQLVGSAHRLGRLRRDVLVLSVRSRPRHQFPPRPSAERRPAQPFERPHRSPQLSTRLHRRAIITQLALVFQRDATTSMGPRGLVAAGSARS